MLKMYLYLHYWCILQAICYYAAVAQRAPPGVNPHHYQHEQGGYQVPQQQMHQAPVQQQQVQYGQVPVQQQQMQQQQMQQQQMHQQVPVQQQVPAQQVPVQQVPVQQQYQQPQQGGHHPHDQPQLLNTANMAHEKEHIAEHLDVPMDTSKMTEQELQFHYFKMHDADNNNKLDGCELIKSLIHWHEQGSHDKQGQVESKIFKDEELITLIDPILNVDDVNKDGFIDYPEFVRAQQKAAAHKPA